VKRYPHLILWKLFYDAFKRVIWCTSHRYSVDLDRSLRFNATDISFRHWMMNRRHMRAQLWEKQCWIIMPLIPIYTRSQCIVLSIRKKFFFSISSVLMFISFYNFALSCNYSDFKIFSYILKKYKSRGKIK